MFFLLVGAGCGSTSSNGAGAAADACSPSTCVPTALATAQSGPHGIAIDARNVYWIHNLPQADGAARTKSSRAPRGDVTALRRSSRRIKATASALAVDSTSVYWTAVSSGNITKAPIVGGTPTLVASGQDGAVAIAVAGTHVYLGDERSLRSIDSLRPDVRTVRGARGRRHTGDPHVGRRYLARLQDRRHEHLLASSR
jgi:hypothetical protein